MCTVPRKVDTCHDYLWCSLSDIFIIQLKNVDSAEEFTYMLSSDEFDFRYQSGFLQLASRIHFADKEKVVPDLSLHYSVLVSLAELEQLRRTTNVFLTHAFSPQSFTESISPL